MSDPDFVAQNGELMTGAERDAWFKSSVNEFRKRGATWFQMSVDSVTDPKLTLLEAWVERPKVQPPPHFQMVAL